MIARYTHRMRYVPIYIINVVLVALIKVKAFCKLGDNNGYYISVFV